jgi:flagellar biosynthesis/type III secretory pathway M-ring protein FliF/YscJ
MKRVIVPDEVKIVPQKDFELNIDPKKKKDISELASKHKHTVVEIIRTWLLPKRAR